MNTQILVLNHKIQNCGVYQYGKRLVDILSTDNTIDYLYCEIESCSEYYNAITNSPGLVAIIYNYHASTMPWLTSHTIQKRIPNIGIPHESPYNMFDIVCDIDPNAGQNIPIPRPIFENIDSIIDNKHDMSSPEIGEFIYKYTDTTIPIFGSFGFGFDNKGFDKIIEFVNAQYDTAVIKMVIPIAHFDPDPMRIHRMREICMKANRKPGIDVMITHDFFSTTDLLRFLHSNTMNIFLYDTMYGRGISSTIDYAISVKKPLAISDSYMFRHIYFDEICLYKNTIQHCLEHSLKHTLTFNEKYSRQNMLNAFRKIIYSVKGETI